MQNDFKCFTGNRKCCKELVTPTGKAATCASQKLNKTSQMEHNRETTETAMRVSEWVSSVRQGKINLSGSIYCWENHFEVDSGIDA